MLRKPPSRETEQRELRWQRFAPLGLALVVLAASVTLVIRSEVVDEPSRRDVPDTLGPAALKTSRQVNQC